jgi:ABC-type amino acid transport substrate-binding protein
MRRRGGLGIRRRGWLNLAAIVALLSLVNLVPQDTSLAEVRRVGLLRVCVPVAYPPLVTGDPDAPGFDVEIVRGVADRLGLRTEFIANSAIGQDFNPRNWRISRAQCEMIAGGVVRSPVTAGFLQTLSTGVATGWVLVATGPVELAPGTRLGVMPGSGRLDRLALSAFLRDAGLKAALAHDPAALGAMVADGRAAAGVTERFVAEQVALAHPGWRLAWLAPDRLPSYPLAIGMWKGDTTLKRAVEREMRAMERDGTLAALRRNYAMACLGGADAC